MVNKSSSWKSKQKGYVIALLRYSLLIITCNGELWKRWCESVEIVNVASGISHSILYQIILFLCTSISFYPLSTEMILSFIDKASILNILANSKLTLRKIKIFHCFLFGSFMHRKYYFSLNFNMSIDTFWNSIHKSDSMESINSIINHIFHLEIFI